MTRISPKQKRVMTWWTPASPDRGRDAIICDGAIRSGKTLFCGISFMLWAMAAFDRKRFGICGKTIKSVRRNLVGPVLEVLEELGMECRSLEGRNELSVRSGEKENTFYLFGGKDEGSAAHIQGVTLAGVLFDEAALQPESFVQQACARCSEPGSRFWFNCNPEGPEHWFYREWIRKAEEKNALYLHFTMEDNPGLTRKIRRRYEKLYSGVFYRRFILGQWVQAEGLVYDFMTEDMYLPEPEGKMEEYVISCDYGTRNPASFGLWGRQKDIWYRMREYYFDSRLEGKQKTDEEYAREIDKLRGGRKVTKVIADPSAASFILTLQRKGYRVVKARNDVMSGIRLTADLLKKRKIVICDGCGAARREFAAYVWEDKGKKDKPRKENDHAMDEIRYFAATAIESGGGGFAATYVER